MDNMNKHRSSADVLALPSGLLPIRLKSWPDGGRHPAGYGFDGGYGLGVGEVVGVEGAAHIGGSDQCVGVFGMKGRCLRAGVVVIESGRHILRH